MKLVGNLKALGIVVADHRVVVATGVLERIFDLIQAALQLREGFHRAQLG